MHSFWKILPQNKYIHINFWYQKYKNVFRCINLIAHKGNAQFYFPWNFKNNIYRYEDVQIFIMSFQMFLKCLRKKNGVPRNFCHFISFTNICCNLYYKLHIGIPWEEWSYNALMRKTIFWCHMLPTNTSSRYVLKLLWAF
jgi:hypothetical protein